MSKIEGVESVEIQPSFKYLEKNLDKVMEIERATGKKPAHCTVCWRLLPEEEDRKKVYTDDPKSAHLLSSVQGGDFTHELLIGTACYRKLRCAEKEG